MVLVRIEEMAPLIRADQMVLHPLPPDLRQLNGLPLQGKEEILHAREILREITILVRTETVRVQTVTHRVAPDQIERAAQVIALELTAIVGAVKTGIGIINS